MDDLVSVKTDRDGLDRVASVETGHDPDQVFTYPRGPCSLEPGRVCGCGGGGSASALATTAMPPNARPGVPSVTTTDLNLIFTTVPTRS